MRLFPQSLISTLPTILTALSLLAVAVYKSTDVLVNDFIMILACNTNDAHWPNTSMFCRHRGIISGQIK